MSQRAVETLLGRLVTDVDFRVRFFAEPREACRDNALVLTQRETAALLRVDLAAIHALALNLDPIIVRAASLTPSGGSRVKPATVVTKKAPRPAGTAGRGQAT